MHAKKWIALWAASLLPWSIMAADTTVQIKGDGIKTQGLLRDGTFYTAPKLLEASKKWTISQETDALYVTVSVGKSAEKVKIPEEVIDGNRYVNFSYFAPKAGVDYVYNEKKHSLKIQKPKKVKKEKAAKDNVEEKLEKIYFLWDPDREFDPKEATLPEMQGKKIISPTWGNYKTWETAQLLPSFSYVKDAQDASWQVMPLIHNDFQPKETSIFLKDKKRQQAMASYLTALAEVYGLEGYNIDFENIDYEDKDRLTSFIQTMAETLHEKNKKLSMDITVYHAGSLNWSLCYDRKALAQWADYQIVMGYDETSRLSRYAGSVSSYSWLDTSIQRLLEEIPPEKLILGLPWYTRVWKGNPGYVTSAVLTWKYEDAYVKKHHLHPIWQKKERQYKATWIENGIPHTLWLEEERSLGEKMSLMETYDLAGVAFWRYGFEK